MKRILMQKLHQWQISERRKPLLLKGARQIGKTYLLQDFGEHYFPQTHYINFEKEDEAANAFNRDLDPERILTELAFYLVKPINHQDDSIIFDEI